VSPGVESPQDAIDSFLVMKMDMLIIHDHVITREKIPPGFERASFTCVPEDIQVEDRFLIRHKLRRLICTSYVGEEHDLIRLYGLHA
jgi:hypothetical protein